MHRLLVVFVRGEVSDDEAQAATENLITSNELGELLEMGVYKRLQLYCPI